MNSPSSRFYTHEHIWVQQMPDNTWLAGITDYAQDLLGDIIYLEPPKPNSSIKNGEACGVIESVKTGSDLHAPMDGLVIEVNEALINLPEEINDSPYKAWIFKFSPSDSDNTEHLLSAEEYSKLID